MTNPGPGLGAGDRVLRRPHFSVIDHDVHFLRSPDVVATLTDLERSIWESAVGDPTLGSLSSTHGPEAVGAVEHLRSLRLVDVAPGTFGAPRRRIVIIEPNSGDASLSVGGVMWATRLDVEYTIATVFSRSNHTTYFDTAVEFFDVDEVTALRQSESARCARLLGGSSVSLGLAESMLRYNDGNWTGEWFLANRPALRWGTTHRPSLEEFDQTCSVVEEYLSSVVADEVWFNIGAGAHADHVLTSIACLSVFARHPDLLSRFAVRMYQDVPYDARFPQHVDNILRELRAWGATVEPDVRPLTDVEAKIELASVFASQVRADTLRADVTASATRGNVAPVETLWHLTSPPEHLEPAAIARDRGEVEDYRRSLDAMRDAFREAPVVRVLLLIPSGRWRRDIDRLLAVWPMARFEVHASPAALEEAARYAPDRVELIPVRDGSLPWLLLVARFAFAAARPTVFVAGNERRAQSERLTKVWIRFPHLVVSSLGRLVAALDDGSEIHPV